MNVGAWHLQNDFVTQEEEKKVETTPQQKQKNIKQESFFFSFSPQANLVIRVQVENRQSNCPKDRFPANKKRRRRDTSDKARHRRHAMHNAQMRFGLLASSRDVAARTHPLKRENGFAWRRRARQQLGNGSAAQRAKLEAVRELGHNSLFVAWCTTHFSHEPKLPVVLYETVYKKLFTFRNNHHFTLFVFFLKKKRSQNLTGTSSKLFFCWRSMLKSSLFLC